MKVNILPIKKLPEKFDLGGDYRATQAALLLSLLTPGECRISNCSKGIDTEKTFNFIKSLCTDVHLADNQFVINGPIDIPIEENEGLTYNGDLYPLTMIVGLVAGFNKSCTLKYSDIVGQDILDTIIGKLNENGIDVHHEADERKIIFRAASSLPIETKVISSLSMMKNCLLIFGLSAGKSVVVQEMKPAGDNLEKIIFQFGGELTINEPKISIVQDPNDPRRKKRVSSAEYIKELKLPSSAKLKASQIEIPPDSDIISALISLAVLRHKEICLDGVPLNSERVDFLNYLKSAGAELKISDRNNEPAVSTGKISLKCREVKARKLSGGRALSLLENIPYMAVVASLGDGATIIRDVADFFEWGEAPCQEIAENLGRMRIKCGIMNDGLVIEGVGGEINGGDFGPFRNFRIALAFYMAALAGQGGSGFEGYEIIQKYYPEIYSLFEKSVKRVTESGAVIK